MAGRSRDMARQRNASAAGRDGRRNGAPAPQIAAARGPGGKPRVWSAVFSDLACATARFAGKPAAFLTASLLVIVWALTGPLFGYSDTWQLVINTSTTIVTFLMVFLIQHTQNRDTLGVCRSSSPS